jgi:S1-C subfamily serine protease
MPPEDESDDEAPGRPPLPPEDRLWRHPSELTSGAGPVGAAAGGSLPPVTSPPRRRSYVWGLLVAGLAGATVSLGLVALTGAWREKVIEKQVAAPTARVAANTPVSLGAGSGVSELVTRTSPSVVGVRVTTVLGPRTGSAVALGPSGNLITSAALVDGADEVTIGLADGSTVAAKVLGSDPITGLAVLDIGTRSVAQAQASGQRPAVGSTAVIVPGSMTGGTGLVSAGVVRGVAQPASTPDGQLHDLIQTDQAPSPESDGAALVGPDGMVVGITLIPSTDPTDATARSGWAVPVDVARQVVDDISADGRAHHVWLGVSIADQDQTPSFSSPGKGEDEPAGALVTAVDPKGPASGVGLVAGDKITQLDGTTTTSMADLISVLRRHRPGDRVELVIWRNAESRTMDVVLKEQPAG